jgi:hypothetical protein
MNSFGTALNSASYTNSATGYSRFVDIDSWIDHHILNVLANNVDALRLSAYFYKPREGKLAFGPIWDFDRALGSTDGRDANPRAWRGSGDATDFFNYPWWDRMFLDPDFYQRYIDRFHELLKATVKVSSPSAVVSLRIGMRPWLSAGTRAASRLCGFRLKAPVCSMAAVSSCEFVARVVLMYCGRSVRRLMPHASASTRWQARTSKRFDRCREARARISRSNARS